MPVKKPLVATTGEVEELTSPDYLSLTSLGIQTATASTGSILTNVLSNVTVTWPTPWPDANYIPIAICQVSGVNLLEVQGVVGTPTKEQVVFAVKNLSLSTVSGTLLVIGISTSKA